MNPTANYIENFLNVKDPCLNFLDCSQTIYKGRKVIMCTAYGYSNFTHLLKRIRLEQNIICFKKTLNRRILFSAFIKHM